MMRTKRHLLLLLVAVGYAGSWTGGGAAAFVSVAVGRRTSPTVLFAADRRPPKNKQKSKKKEFTIKELMEEMKRNPSAFTPVDANQKSKTKRTRKRASNPQQSYAYAAQRSHNQNNNNKTTTTVNNEWSPLYQARQLGMVNAAAQHVDALVDGITPKIVGRLQVGEETGTSAAYAYVIEKPPGWAIVGAGAKQKKMTPPPVAAETSVKEGKTSGNPKRNGARLTKIKAVDEDGSVEEIEVDESELLAVMTPEEIAEFRAEGGFGGTEEEKSTPTKTKIKAVDEDGSVNVVEVDESELFAAMTPEEIAECRAEGGFDDTEKKESTPTNENLRKIEARKSAAQGGKVASFAATPRPSVVSWLKELKANQGTPIRGGKYWTAVAGATNVDDTGLVLLCPKDKTENLFVDFTRYVAVVGNGKYLAPKSKTERVPPKDLVRMEIVGKLRKGRLDDAAQTVGVTVLECPSTCSSIVPACQSQFQDGIRGDPTANPLDRRASRRLIHCNALAVSSLIVDDSVEAQVDTLPDDIAVLSDRRNNHQYTKGSFLGRQGLRRNPRTTAYREINGAADGFEGWLVDRYDKWLLVQHDNKQYRGPLPSAHDGFTAGVYYLPANPDRSAMGSRENVRPTLLEGKAAPEVLPILENGITYHVNLDKDLSTGIFLDQRLQRAWLANHCDEDTRVLNCFAHCGAFSIAAASAGASTVSLDLNKKWLDRIEPQLLANGIEFDEKHDCIYGDCFDWLARLAKRGETFDIVILDPPSSSVGGKKKKRWSVKSDMSSLVALAAPLVKKGGLLWTTTNSANIHPIRFARMCKKGFDEAGIPSAKLERIAPMPVDFPSIGPAPVKNLVWRLP